MPGIPVGAELGAAMVGLVLAVVVLSWVTVVGWGLVASFLEGRDDGD